MFKIPLFNAVTLKDDIFIYIESDLIWLPKTIKTLINHLINNYHVDIITPLNIDTNNNLFYDTWGYRKNGVKFQKHEPFHSDIRDVKPGELIQIDSAGSCLIMNNKVARKVRIRNENSIVGWCEDARNQEFNISIDANERVYHP